MKSIERKEKYLLEISKKSAGIIAAFVTLLFVAALFYNAIVETSYLQQWVPVFKWY